jgi:glyoxylase-like metal-dependent hydrolase (beta-lactamase superfamily II)
VVDITQIANNIYLIDDQLFSIPKWGSVYLLDEERKALVETGPAISANLVLDGIRHIGLDPEEIAYIIVTHIHLDHAGGAGVLAHHMPRAKVVVHNKGARHLIDPKRLVASAIEARGDAVIAMHGEVLPVDAGRVRAVAEGDTITLSNQQTLEFIDAPGHAPHELCIYESRNGGVFTGDAVGVYIADFDILLPFHPPPQFDLELCLRTLERLGKLSASNIYYSHFGPSQKVKEHLDRAREMLLVWDNIVIEATDEGALGDAERRLIAQANNLVKPISGIKSFEPMFNYLVNTMIPMCAAGHMKYYREVTF